MRFCPLLLLVVLAAADLLKTVYVKTLAQLVAAMEDPEVGRIFLNASITLEGSPLPTIDGRLLEIEANPDACEAPCTLFGAGGRIFNVGGQPGGLILAGLTLRDARGGEGNGSAVYVAAGVGQGSGMLSVNAVRFVNNSAAGDGGAVWAGHRAILSLAGCDFEENSALHGGAVAGYGVQLGVSESTFRRNAAAVAGGALALEGGNASLSLSSSLLEENGAGAEGGGALSLGGAAKDRSLASLGVVTCGMHAVTLRNNSARGPGGAIRCGPFGQLAANGCDLSANVGAGRGGALALDAPNPSAITNTSFRDNVLVDGAAGGAALCFGSDPSGRAPASLAASVLHNATFQRNDIQSGAGRGALLLLEGELIFASSAFSENVIRGREDDVCAFGADTAALFKPAEKPSACGPCAGRGVCA